MPYIARLCLNMILLVQCNAFLGMCASSCLSMNAWYCTLTSEHDVAGAVKYVPRHVDKLKHEHECC